MSLNRFVLAFLCGIVILRPGAVLGQDKADGLPAEYALVPRDTFAILHFRPADLWQSELVARLRQDHAAQFEQALKALGEDPAETQTLTIVCASPQSLAFFDPGLGRSLERLFDSPGRTQEYAPKIYTGPKIIDKYGPPPFKDKFDSKDKFDPKEKFEPPSFKDKKGEPRPEPKGEPRPKDKDKDAKDISTDFSPVSFPWHGADRALTLAAGAQAAAEKDSPLSGIAIIETTVKPFQQSKVNSKVLGKAAKEQKHAGKSFLASANGCVYFISPNAYLFTFTTPAMKRILDGQGVARGEGPLAPALERILAKQQVVIGFSGSAPAAAAWKKAMAEDRGHGTEETLRLLLSPLLEARGLAFGLDLGKQIRVQMDLAFADKDRAADAAGILQDGLVLLRVFALSQSRMQLKADIRRMLLDYENDRVGEAVFQELVLRNLENASRSATVKQVQSSVQFSAQASFDLGALRAQAKTATADLFKNVDKVAVARRRSQNNLKQLVLTLHMMNDVYRSLPPAAHSDKDGKPLLSWRVQILPYIEESALYVQFKMNEPWDSPHNIKLLPKMPKVFAPVGGVKTKEPYSTFYQAIVGPGCAFEPGANKRLSIPRDFTDGTSNTIGLVEGYEAVPWTKPADVTFDPKQPLPRFGGLFTDGFHAALMDGSVRFLKPAKTGVSAQDAARSGEISVETLLSAILRNDGKAMGPDW